MIQVLRGGKSQTTIGQTRSGYAYLNQRIVDLAEDQEKIGTISRKQRELINEGIDEINHQDQAMRAALRPAKTKAYNSFLARFANVLLLLPFLLCGMPGVTSMKVANKTEFKKAAGRIARRWQNSCSFYRFRFR